MASCDRVRRALAEYAVGALAGRASARVERHLEACPACRAELAALNRTGELVSSIGLEAAPEGVWQAVRAEIEQRRAPRRLRPRPVLRRWALAAVAAVLVAFALFLLPMRRTPHLVVVPMAEADEELQQTMHRHLTATESTPLADSAAIGLALGSWEDDS